MAEHRRLGVLLTLLGLNWLVLFFAGPRPVNLLPNVASIPDVLSWISTRHNQIPILLAGPMLTAFGIYLIIHKEHVILQEPKFCHDCGTKLEKECKFCSHCGAVVIRPTH